MTNGASAEPRPRLSVEFISVSNDKAGQFPERPELLRCQARGVRTAKEVDARASTSMAGLSKQVLQAKRNLRNAARRRAIELPRVRQRPANAASAASALPPTMGAGAAGPIVKVGFAAGV